MAWTKIPAENHPLFMAALPKDPRVETMKMFGGVAARVNGNMFAGLFGLSTIIWLPEDERGEALALEGAEMFDPMGNGRKSDKVMLPVAMMDEPTELRHWVARAFKAASALPRKTQSKKKSKGAPKPATKTTTKKPSAKKPSPKKATAKPKKRARAKS